MVIHFISESMLFENKTVLLTEVTSILRTNGLNSSLQTAAVLHQIKSSTDRGDEIVISDNESCHLIADSFSYLPIPHPKGLLIVCFDHSMKTILTLTHPTV